MQPPEQPFACSVKGCPDEAPFTWDTFGGSKLHLCDDHVPTFGYEEVVIALLEVLRSYTQGIPLEHLAHQVQEWLEKQVPCSPLPQERSRVRHAASRYPGGGGRAVAAWKRELGNPDPMAPTPDRSPRSDAIGAGASWLIPT